MQFECLYSLPNRKRNVVMSKAKRGINQQVGQAIAKYRKAAGFSQAQVAEMLGLSNDAISRMERGTITLNIERLCEFADLFKCRVVDLLTDSQLHPSDQIYQLDRMLAQLETEQRKMLITLIEQMIAWKQAD